MDQITSSYYFGLNGNRVCKDSTMADNVGLVRCACGAPATRRFGGPTPEQLKLMMEWEKWANSLGTFFHGHPPIEALSLPAKHVCESCLVIYEVMEE